MKIQIAQIEVDPRLYDFVNKEVLPGTLVQQQVFWTGFADLITTLSPENDRLLTHRDQLQSKIDAWHRARPGSQFDQSQYKKFLVDIGYLVPEQCEFQIDTDNIDDEIAKIAGPQLVVPVSNARYALNAANARWGSLYDALYGTDAIAETGDTARSDAFNPKRGAKVIAFARDFLDQHFPLQSGSHRDVTAYGISPTGLSSTLRSGEVTTLRHPGFKGYQGSRASPSVLLMVHHGLHVEIHIDRSHVIGKGDAAGVSDVVLEAALTTIQDCEDSVAAVSVGEKMTVYRNWLGLMKGTLEATVTKGPRELRRRLHDDRRYRSVDGTEFQLPGRSLMWVRNVGSHMMNDAITHSGNPVAETLIDAVVTALIAIHDLRGANASRNSRRQSIYIVKPKMHGPAEVAFADRLFSSVEDLLGLARHTLKMGIMDEERRTSVNLTECIRAARHRVAFINTGFLDRTGDEIHTSMEAAAVSRKGDLKKARWLDTYERQNVDIGLECGLRGRAQIGKGMWAMPDLMADMLATKIAQPRAGASTAWVPSPTAATLHALHYHSVNVAAVQINLATRQRASLDDLLTPPLAGRTDWSATEIEEELNNNVQSILGYVVRWIDFGVGCSKVPDYFNVALMEDRATLRISSQHIANWLHHKICTRDQVMQALQRMAGVVDRQNATDPAYRPMSHHWQASIAFNAACDLIFNGRDQPNGYTEAILRARRLAKLAATT
jgi:malate synthase